MDIDAGSGVPSRLVVARTTNLVHLSGDIFAQIARFKNMSIPILTLWKCGDATLNKKICDWVDEIDLEDQNSSSTSRYPTFLSSLSKLRVLRLVRYGRLAPNTVLSHEVQKLSSTLTELTLSSFIVDDPFRAFSISQHGREIEPVESERDQPSYYWNVTSKFPHLTKLVLKRSKLPSPIECSSSLLKVLPPSLLHLEIDTHLLKANNDEPIAHLPPHLHTLITPWDAGLAFPPSLTHLQLQSSTSARLRLATPTTSHNGGSMADTQHTVMTPVLLEVPSLSGLHSLRIDSSKLSRLCVPGSLSASDLLSLPPTLTHLEAKQLYYPSFVRYSSSKEKDFMFETFWPRNLCVLRFDLHIDGRALPHDFPEHLIAQLGHALPSSITDFNCFARFCQLGFDWTFLMSHLPHLTALGLQGTGEFPSQLPPTLTKLELATWVIAEFFDCLSTSSLVDLEIRLWDDRTEPLVAKDIFRHLPRTLERFRAAANQSIIWESDAWSALPHSLRTFEFIGYMNSPDSSSTLPYLPPNLTKLCLELDSDDTPTNSDMLAMPCYDKLRDLEFRYRRSKGRSSEDSAYESWPEATALTSFGALPANRLIELALRDLQHPDPRVGSPTIVAEMPASFIMELRRSSINA